MGCMDVCVGKSGHKRMQPYLVDRMYHRRGEAFARACICAKGQTDSMRRSEGEE